MPPNRGTEGGTRWVETHPSPGSPRPISANQPDFIGAKCPAFKTTAIRVQTFSSGAGWPIDKTQTPDEIAEAGLFFVGKIDCTKCFCCGIGLRNWLPGDIPAVEHARWDPSCRYIRWLKGNAFVDSVDETYPRIVIPFNTNENASPPASSSIKPTPNQTIVDSVMMTSSCHALKRCGYSKDVIRSAISKVLRENHWDEKKVTTNQLALAAINISEGCEEHNNTNSTPTGEGRNRVTEITRPITVDDGASDGIPSPPNSIDSTLDTDAEEEKLAADNLQMKAALRCKICLDATVSVLFLPCGHIVTCSECSSRQRKCPICRSKIATFATVHLSSLSAKN